MFGDGSSSIQNIGFRHGEKLYESLLSVEERVKAEDRGDYFRVSLDARDLNYSVFFEEGEQRPQELESYTSHNTTRLDLDGVKQLLLTIPEVRTELGL
jgi:UDP-glucose 4-epimerase